MIHESQHVIGRIPICEVSFCTSSTKTSFVPSDNAIRILQCRNLGIEHGMVHEETMTQDDHGARATRIFKRECYSIDICCFHNHTLDAKQVSKNQQTDCPTRRQSTRSIDVSRPTISHSPSTGLRSSYPYRHENDSGMRFSVRVSTHTMSDGWDAYRSV